MIGEVSHDKHDRDQHHDGQRACRNAEKPESFWFHLPRFTVPYENLLCQLVVANDFVPDRSKIVKLFCLVDGEVDAPV